MKPQKCWICHRDYTDIYLEPPLLAGGFPSPEEYWKQKTKGQEAVTLQGKTYWVCPLCDLILAEKLKPFIEYLFDCKLSETVILLKDARIEVKT